jgi:hypothetical protein
LPIATQETANKNFTLLKSDSRHPSLHFKKVGKYYSARVGLSYRALGIEVANGVLWFWIGNHSEYDKIIG